VWLLSNTKHDENDGEVNVPLRRSRIASASGLVDSFTVSQLNTWVFKFIKVSFIRDFMMARAFIAGKREVIDGTTSIFLLYHVGKSFFVSSSSEQTRRLSSFFSFLGSKLLNHTPPAPLHPAHLG